MRSSREKPGVRTLATKAAWRVEVALPFEAERFFILTPFAWPIDAVVPFDRALLTGTIDRLGNHSVRTWRWRQESGRLRWPVIRPMCKAVCDLFVANGVQAELVLSSQRATVIWPRWNRIRGLNLRDDIDRVESVLVGSVVASFSATQSSQGDGATLHTLP